jgi:hypothetical protein
MRLVSPTSRASSWRLNQVVIDLLCETSWPQSIISNKPRYAVNELRHVNKYLAADSRMLKQFVCVATA